MKKKKTHIKQLNLALHNSLNVYSLKCVCACTHIHVECTSSTEYFMLILEKKIWLLTSVNFQISQ